MPKRAHQTVAARQLRQSRPIRHCGTRPVIVRGISAHGTPDVSRCNPQITDPGFSPVIYLRRFLPRYHWKELGSVLAWC